MSRPTGVTDEVRAYYDEHVEVKLRGLLRGNPRVEAGCRLIGEWAPPTPRRILEIGCGMGEVCWRMARCFPAAEVVGVDISAKSIETATRLFGGDRLRFVEALVTPDLFGEKFDLIVMMDVYEHIAPQDRAILHASIDRFLSDSGRFLLTFPTPRKLAWLRANDPKGIQPVDEDITAATIHQLSTETHTSVLLYREVDIWETGDYAHAVLARGSFLAPISREAGISARIARRLRLVAGDRNGMRRPPQAEIEGLVVDRLGRPTLDRLNATR